MDEDCWLTASFCHGFKVHFDPYCPWKSQQKAEDWISSNAHSNDGMSSCDPDCEELHSKFTMEAKFPEVIELRWHEGSCKTFYPLCIFLNLFHTLNLRMMIETLSVWCEEVIRQFTIVVIRWESPKCKFWLTNACWYLKFWRV